jgi:hypothetical protein
MARAERPRTTGTGRTVRPGCTPVAPDISRAHFAFRTRILAA